VSTEGEEIARIEHAPPRPDLVQAWRAPDAGSSQDPRWIRGTVVRFVPRRPLRPRARPTMCGTAPVSRRAQNPRWVNPLRAILNVMDDVDGVLEALLSRCRRDHAGWLNGDPSGYEFTSPGSSIMGAFGGTGTDLIAMTAGQRRGVAQFQGGEGTVDYVAGGVSGDVAWLVMQERGMVAFDGQSESQRWDLRVTELFRREGDAWVRFHRHADPFVDFHPLDEVLSLLR
jgi:hypothetical protein